MNKILKTIADWGKRYFLWAAHNPLMAGVLCGAVPATTIVCGWTIALIVMSWFGGLNPSADPWFFGSTFTFLGLGVVLGIVNNHVCRRCVSYRRESGMFLLVGPDPISGSIKLAAAGNPVWGKGIWIDLPPTDRPYTIELVRGNLPGWSVPVNLEVVFKDKFDPQEVWAKIRLGGYCSFDDWLREKFLAAVSGYPGVQKALGQPRDRTSAEVEDLLERVDFPKPLNNIAYIGVHVNMSVVVRFH